MSIPKLELQAAVIAVQHKTTVMEEINLETKKIILVWFQNGDKLYS